MEGTNCMTRNTNNQDNLLNPAMLRMEGFIKPRHALYGGVYYFACVCVCVC